MKRLCTVVAVLTICACGSGSSPNQRASSDATIGQKPQGEGRSKLWLSAARGPEANTVVLTVHYEKGEAAGPRVADLRIAHSDALGLTGSSVGTAAVAAGKELTTQRPQPGLVRLVLLSRDTKELATGELAQLTFKRLTSDPAKLDLVMDRPIFAPAESMQGLVLGEALQL